MVNSDTNTPSLTPKQRRFVEEYLLDMNATQAAIRAGFSERTANQQGPRLLEHPAIMAAIDAAKIKRSEKLEVDAEWMLQRLVAEAEADLADLYDQNNNLKQIENWPEIWRQGLVAGVEIEALFAGYGENRIQIGEVKKLKLSDRVRRLELIGKHVRVNAFQEVVQHKGLDGLAERLDRAAKRATETTIAPRAQPRPAPSPAEAPKPVPPPPPAPSPPQRPSPYRPILPEPEPAPWPQSTSFAATDYDPT